jgi:hypothetical protein
MESSQLPGEGSRDPARPPFGVPHIASAGFLASTAWVVAANAQANVNPNVYPGNTSERYGARPAPYEWYASPGPMKRGNMCVKDVDPTRGYGRFLHQRRCMAQRGRSSVQRQFHQKRHLAQHWVWNVVLVARHRSHPAPLGLRGSAVIVGIGALATFVRWCKKRQATQTIPTMPTWPTPSGNVVPFIKVKVERKRG